MRALLAPTLRSTRALLASRGTPVSADDAPLPSLLQALAEPSKVRGGSDSDRIDGLLPIQQVTAQTTQSLNVARWTHLVVLIKWY
jgi:hypothetical protein